MEEIITAVYENGVLRPLHPLALAEHQTVQLRMLPEQPADEEAAVIQLVVSAGLMSPPASQAAPPPDPVSPEERRQLAEQLGQAPGRSLSEIVIAERDRP